MTQRSYNNLRNQNKDYKGSGRKSASSAKIKSKAGSTVYQKSLSAKQKRKKEIVKQKNKEEKQKARIESAAVDAELKRDPKYKIWRRIWIVCVVFAALGVLSSFLFAWGIKSDMPLEFMSDFREPLTYVSLILGYGGLIAAIVIDLVPIRRLRKQYKEKVHLTKRERKQVEKALEERAADKKGFKKKNQAKSDASKKAAEAKATDKSDEKNAQKASTK